MSILKMFDLDANNYNIIAEDPTAFEKKRDTVNLVVGKEVSYNASIAGKQIPAFVTLESARLTVFHCSTKRQLMAISIG